jgi:hypothetical protein
MAQSPHIHIPLKFDSSSQSAALNVDLSARRVSGKLNDIHISNGEIRAEVAEIPMDRLCCEISGPRLRKPGMIETPEAKENV